MKLFKVGDIVLHEEADEILIVVKVMLVDGWPLYALENDGDIYYAGIFHINDEYKRIGKI